jgi:hypothetical protein
VQKRRRRRSLRRGGPSVGWHLLKQPRSSSSRRGSADAVGRALGMGQQQQQQRRVVLLQAGGALGGVRVTPGDTPG